MLEWDLRAALESLDLEQKEASAVLAHVDSAAAAVQRSNTRGSDHLSRAGSQAPLPLRLPAPRPRGMHSAPGLGWAEWFHRCDSSGWHLRQPEVGLAWSDQAGAGAGAEASTWRSKPIPVEMQAAA